MKRDAENGRKIFEKFDFHQRLTPRIYKEELQLNYKTKVLKKCLCIILLSIAVPKHNHQNGEEHTLICRLPSILRESKGRNLKKRTE